MQLFEISDDQRRIYIDTAQLHEAYRDAFTKSRAYRESTHWKPECYAPSVQVEKLPPMFV